MNVLLTGGTGFLGEYLLAELLQRGHSVFALYRNVGKKICTVKFLQSIGLGDRVENIKWLEGDILQCDEKFPEWLGQHQGLDNIDCLLHSAAALNFKTDSKGEPFITNVAGSRVLKRLLDRHPMQAHILSTAFVCGRIKNTVVPEISHSEGEFTNSYEKSKWEAERIWEGKATILRPGVIIGHSETGRCTSFNGWYVVMRGVHLLSQFLDLYPMRRRYRLHIEIPADPDATANLVPVDYVAKAAIRIIENPRNHNRIFHLTHPKPPTNQWSYDFICKRFSIGGMRFVGSGSQLGTPRNEIERMIRRHIRAMLPYFSNNPTFDRSNTDKAIPLLQVPEINEVYLDKVVEYAVNHNWGHHPAPIFADNELLI